MRAPTAVAAATIASLLSIPVPVAAYPECDAPSTTPTKRQVARVDYGAPKHAVDRKLGSHGSLAFAGKKFTTYDYGIADCTPGWATVTFGRWQKDLRVVSVKWED